MKLLYAPLLLILLSSCAVQVKTYQNPDITMSSYESWCWMKGCEIVYQGPEHYRDERVINEISNAVAWNMHDKGYIQGDDQSDLVVNFYLILKEDSTTVRDFYTEDYEYEDERSWLPVLYPDYQRFVKGSLVIDVLDRKQSKLVWTTTAIKYLDINPEYDKQAIWNGVNKAMKKFPAKTE